LNDLYPFVGLARDDSGGNSLGFYNVQDGDAPAMKRLVDEYTPERQLSSVGDGRNCGESRGAWHWRRDLLDDLRRDDPAARVAGSRSDADLADLQAGTLPAVSFVKPDSYVDGNPASSKLGLFEAMLENIVDQVGDRKDTALFVAFDEGGGYWDSGYYQPLDFFGDGPRIPFIVVSPYAKHGQVVHTYYDHVSILKFIEANWGLSPLTGRSRDKLPNPVAAAGNPYVPKNSPAIGDLMDMFDFQKDH
jgi:hypothetical protein